MNTSYSMPIEHMHNVWIFTAKKGDYKRIFYCYGEYEDCLKERDKTICAGMAI